MGRLNKEADDQNKVFTHSTHGHHLTLTKLLEKNQALCSGCRAPILAGNECLACAACGFYLHDSCFNKPPFMMHGSHPHPLVLKYKAPSEGFRCDLCGQPGYDQWLYCCEPCDFDVHLHYDNCHEKAKAHSTAQERSVSEIYHQTRSSGNVSGTNQPILVSPNGATISTTPQGPLHGTNPTVISPHSGMSQPAIVSPNGMTITTPTGLLHNTSPPMVSPQSQHRPNVTHVIQSGNPPHGFNPATASPSVTSQPFPISPNGMMMITANQIPTSNVNPQMGVAQYRPNVAYTNQGTSFPAGAQAHHGNGVVYLNSPQGSNNQPLYLRPNGGGAPMAMVPPQHNQGVMGGITGMAIGGFVSGVGQELAGVAFNGVADALWGDHQGSMDSDHGDGGGGSDIMNNWVGDYGF